MSGSPAGVGSRLRRLAADVGGRLQRGRLDRLQPGASLVIAAALLCVLGLAVVSSVAPVPPALGSLGETRPVVADAPPWLRASVYVALGLATAVAVLSTTPVVASRRAAAGALRVALVTITALCASAIAALGAVARGDPVVATLAACAATIGIVVALVSRTRKTSASGWMHAAGALLSGSGWWLLAATTSGEVVPDDPVWVTATMIVLDVAVVVAFWAFSRLGGGRVALVRRRMHLAHTLPGVTVLAAFVVALAALRLTVLSTMLDDDRTSGDAALWSLRSPESWPHAAVVALLIVWFALRTHQRPVTDRGLRPILAILTAAFALAAALSILLAISYLLAAAFGLPLVDVAPLLTCGPVDCLVGIRVLAVLSLTAFLTIPAFHGTSASAVALVSVVFLLPGTLSPVIDAAWPGAPALWSTPVEVVLAIVVLCVVLIAARWLGAARAVPLDAVARLLVYPLLVVHAVDLVPAVLGEGFAAVVASLAILLSLLLLLPPVSTDRSRQTRVLAVAAGLALFASISLVMPARSEEWSALAQVTAVLLLAIPVTTSLVMRTTRWERPVRAPSRRATQARPRGAEPRARLGAATAPAHGQRSAPGR